jgi:hypothetical protein
LYEPLCPESLIVGVGLVVDVDRKLLPHYRCTLLYPFISTSCSIYWSGYHTTLLAAEAVGPPLAPRPLDSTDERREL